MHWFENENMLTVVSLWFLVIGVVTILFLVFEQVRRSRKLKKLGLVEQSNEAQKVSAVEILAKKVSTVFAATDHEIAEKLTSAGFYNTKHAYLLLPLKYLLLVAGGALIITLGIQFEMRVNQYVVAAVLWGVMTIVVPDMYLNIRANNIRRKLSNQLPYLLDLMGMCVQTGMTVESAMTYLAQEMIGFDVDMALMLKRTNERAQIVGLDQAIKELYNRVPTPEFRSFVMTLSQSLKYGSSIYTVLTTLAMDIREVQMLNLEEKIGKLSAKMSIPLIIFIMFPIVILITAPGIMRMM